MCDKPSVKGQAEECGCFTGVASEPAQVIKLALPVYNSKSTGDPARSHLPCGQIEGQVVSAASERHHKAAVSCTNRDPTPIDALAAAKADADIAGRAGEEVDDGILIVQRERDFVLEKLPARVLRSPAGCHVLYHQQEPPQSDSRQAVERGICS